MKYAALPAITITIASLLISGCGGSSSPVATTAGIDGTGVTQSPVPVVSSGTVTGFGSVFVNGIRFDTSSTSFTIDGNPGSQDDLAVGDVVVVRGELESEDSTEGSASSIVFDDVVEGPVASIDSAASSIVVLGQSVLITPNTSFDDSIQPASIAGLAIDQTVEVSGFVSSDGSISATRIEPKLTSMEYELTGIVASTNIASSQFSIGAQVIDYSSAMLSDFDDGTIDTGELVEVKASTTLGSGGEMIATRIEFKGSNVSGDDGDRIEIEGFISRFSDITDFDVSGFPVSTNGSPFIEGGLTSDLGLDVKVEVEGSLNNGVLEATRIEIRRSSAVRIVANVDSVDLASNSFVVLGITVAVDDATRLEDKGPMDLDSFAIDDLLVNDYVEVRGTELPAGSGQVLASLLERDDDDTEVELQGFVEAGSAVSPSFEILGVTVTTNAGTVFRDSNDAVISAGQFFASAEGRLVKAEGVETSDQEITADEVEFE